MGIAQLRVVGVLRIAASQLLQQRHRTQRGKGEAAIALTEARLRNQEMDGNGIDGYGSIAWLKLLIISLLVAFISSFSYRVKDWKVLCAFWRFLIKGCVSLVEDGTETQLLAG